ncbi:ParB/RepB/Spo0J family partition protein [Pseudonocardia spinosispora]|uniref:ParB/RepB/Spo0J family partition protein n=1 Tax=Pseudonocardia spinosispora TaxID=103441 RepID=UPI001FE014CF|nr:ParB/RepB/Spo0J family partition protein [Pseudonocardia spinosispora]
MAQDDFYEPAQPAPTLRAAEPLSVDTPSAAVPPPVVEAAAVPEEVSTAPEGDLGGTRTVPIGDLANNPLNKRHVGGDDELLEMAETIRQHGVIQPLVVCSAEAYLAAFPSQRMAIGDARWITLIGNRRLAAARLVPLTEVSIVVNDGQVSSMYEVMLIENGQRKDLPPVLEAEAIEEAIKASGISQRELARRIGKSHMYVSQRLSLLKLIPEFRELFERGVLKVERARQLGELPQSEQRRIHAGGPPYLSRPVPGGSRPGTRVIRVSSPAVAAESIRAKFNDDELSLLVSLLSEQLKLAESAVG